VFSQFSIFHTLYIFNLFILVSTTLVGMNELIDNFRGTIVLINKVAEFVQLFFSESMFEVNNQKKKNSGR
jgi:hypothetical protein